MKHKKEPFSVGEVDKLVKPYEEFKPKEGKGWGDILYKGKIENMYTSETVIYDWLTEPLEKILKAKEHPSLVDFGGAAGATLEVIVRQLHNDQLTTYVIDANREALERGQKKFPQLTFLEANLSAIPVADKTFDAGYARLVIQYNPLVPPQPGIASQEDILKEIHRVLKPGGSFVLIWPAARTKVLYEGTNNALGEINAFVSGRSPSEINMRSSTDPETMITLAEKVGFTILDSRQLLSVGITSEGFYDRFGEKMKAHGRTLDQLKNFYQETIKKYVGQVETEKVDGEEVIMSTLHRVVLKA